MCQIYGSDNYVNNYNDDRVDDSCRICGEQYLLQLWALFHSIANIDENDQSDNENENDQKVDDF